MQILEDLAKTLGAVIKTLADFIESKKPKAPIPKTVRVRLK